MSRTISKRLLAQSPFTATAELCPAPRLPLRCLRPLSSTCSKRAEKDDDALNSLLDALPAPPTREINPPSNLSRPTSQISQLSPRSPSLASNAKVSTWMTEISKMLTGNQAQRGSNQRARYDPAISTDGEAGLVESREEREERPHQLSIYASKHNTHIAIGAPNGNCLLHMSAGSIGFRKSARKHYDSAFQLASYMMVQMQNKGIIKDIRKMEVTLRGFGAGREAVTKALLGSEGRNLRGKIVKVADATRLKFGGTRSKKPRRLG